MRVLIWGAGAIGGVIGAHLARAGHDITFVDRVAEHVERIRTTGLSLTGPVAEFTVQTPAYTPQGLEGTWETILLCVKAQDTRSATHTLAPHLAADGAVVSVQNGLNELVIQEIIGPERTVGCFINFGADYLEPGVILYGGRGAVVVGEIDGRITPRVEALHRLFLDFDDQAVLTDNIWGYLWGKLGYGSQLFATALTNDSIADALNDSRYQDVYIGLAREVLRVALARGIQPQGFNGYDPSAFLPDVDIAVARASLADMVRFNRGSAKTHSGVWRDLAVRKRKTEADDQLAPIVALGREVGVETPLVARLVELVHDVEEGRRPQSTDNLEELRSLV